MNFYNLPSLLLVVIALTGCGQMGPLYIPVEVPPAPVVPKAAVQPVQEMEMKPVPNSDAAAEKKPPPAKAKTTSKSNKSSQLKK